jgi:hypothetical protein
MAIKEKDLKLLWGRSGNRCSICRIELSFDAQHATFPVGEQAHIVGREKNGPRGQSPLTPEERDSYSNLLLLCPTHHAIIDKAEEEYTVERLHEIKADHELWVRTSLARRAGEDTAGGADLAESQSLLELGNYAGSFQRLRNASASQKETARYHVLCVLTILAGRSVNGIDEGERGQVTRHLLRALGMDRAWRPTLLLMLLVDLDYCAVHGFANDFGIRTERLLAELKSARSSLPEESLILKLPMSSRSRATLRRA